MEYGSEIGEWFRFFAGVVAGGLVSTWLGQHLQSRRARRDLTLKMIEQFSSVEAHKQRMEAWGLFYGLPEGQTLETYGNADDAVRAGAFRYVLNFFVQAGALLDRDLIDRDLFFTMAHRWMLDPYRNFIGPAMERTTAPSYVTHIAALRTLEAAWKRWERGKPKAAREGPANN